jgi:hypothetical protein
MKLKEQITLIHLDKEESEVWERARDILERMERQVGDTNDEELYDRIGKAIEAIAHIHFFHIVLDKEGSEC